MKLNIYLTQLTTRSAGVVSGQSFGSSTVNLARISSMCSVQCFPGGHSLRLAFGSFFYRLILTVFCCSFKLFFFLRCLRLCLVFLCNRCFFVIWGDNLGRTFISAFGHGFFAWVFRLLFHGLKVQQQLCCGAFSRRIECFALTCLAVKQT